MGEINQGKD